MTHYPTRVLITGANGWIGSALYDSLSSDANTTAIACSRQRTDHSNWRPLPSLDSTSDKAAFEAVTRDVDVIIHTAARAHHPKETSEHTEHLYDRINHQGTKLLTQAAQDNGVQTFIFLSSVKAMGEDSGSATWDENHCPQPEDAYGRSKYQAEQTLLALTRQGTMRAHCLRLPLVIGSQPKGNLLRLQRLIQNKIPLPFASLKNQRSMLALPNLISAIQTIIHSNSLNSGIYCLSDTEAVSTPELIQALGLSIQQAPRMYPIHPAILGLAFRCLGRGKDWQRLSGSLVINNRRFCNTFGWTPPTTALQCLQAIDAITDQ